MSDSPETSPPSEHQAHGAEGLPDPEVKLDPFGILATLILVSSTLLLIASIVARKTVVGGMPAANELIQHLTLWITFVGGILAAAEGRHLALATSSANFPPKVELAVKSFTGFVSVLVCAILAYASAAMVYVEVENPAELIKGVPAWISYVILPVGFAGVAVFLILQHSEKLSVRLASAAGILVAGACYFLPAVVPEEAMIHFRWPAFVLLMAAVGLGAPIFVGIGGAALLFFAFADWPVPVAIVPTSTVQLVTKAELPMIPLLTFAGYLLAESNASQRLLRVFRAVVGWMPGGLAIVTACVCAFFTTFTGGSGITILALGGLVLPALIKEAYPRDFSIGLVTASGSLGLLFPPSFPVILYAIVAQSVISNLPEATTVTPPSIENLFIAGFVPGVLLLAITALYGTYTAVRVKIPRPAFDLGEARAALWEAKWEVLLPFVVLVAFFSGFTTIVEAAAVTVLYVYVIEVFFYKDLSPIADLYRVARSSAYLVGGVLMILGVAFGLTAYFVDAEIPQMVLELFEEHVESPIVFLALLNVFLLIVGCLMDIFSAIMVVVPIITPVALAYGVDPVHLGIIFIANLELGYLTPPVGINLFLSSFRFEEPLVKVYKDVIPFLLLLLVGVLIITYVPAITTGVLETLGPIILPGG